MVRSLLPLALVAQPALADTDGYGHMSHWGSGYGAGMMFGPVLWLIVIGLIVAALIWFARRVDGAPQPGREKDALSELDLRLARGEIDPDDYSARKALLTK
ncbi:SHOCT domain-containing protein [Litorisediminicola beolgyonensis]|uniref:SHOCT domain-containing protein n=1 Tax=Litorisediminicola beolgyonensis TaxID=1173614 RepID=A0ABW3ZE69_9RHOB